MVNLHVTYDSSTVALSCGMAFAGCFTAVSLMEQYRLSTTAINESKGSLILMVFVSASLGGVAIWCLHFVACTSLSFSHDGVHVPVRFNLGLLIISLVVSVIIQFISIYVASKDSWFNKPKHEIVELFINRARNSYSMLEIKRLGPVRLMFLLCTHNLTRILFGGVFSGFGGSLVIYLGIMSMEFQGRVVYRPGMVALTAILAAIFATNGFVTILRVLSVFPSMDSLRLVVALNSLFFMSGMHYIGLNSVVFEYDPMVELPLVNRTISSHDLLNGILVAAVLFCLLVIIYVVSDLRAWLLRTSAQLRQADIVIEGLYKLNRAHNIEAVSPANRDLVRYINKYSSTLNLGTSTADVTAESAPLMRNGLLYNDYSEDENSSADPTGTGNSRFKIRQKPNKSKSNSSLHHRSNAYVACDDVPIAAEQEDNSVGNAILANNNMIAEE